MDLSLVPLKDLLDEFSSRYVCVVAWLENEGGQVMVKIDSSNQGKFIEKAGLIATLQYDFFKELEDE